MEVAGANRRWRLPFRCRGSRHESAVAQLFSLGCISIMPRYTLNAYADGADFDDIAETLEARFRQFVTGRRWIVERPTIVNRYYGATVITQTGLAELWDLGLAVTLPEVGTEFPKWFVDVEAIARFLGALHREFGRSFSLGFIDSETNRHEELFDVSKLPVIDGVSYVV